MKNQSLKNYGCRMPLKIRNDTRNTFAEEIRSALDDVQALRDLLK